MNQSTDETIWQRLSSALFGAGKTTDERFFTARVMAEIRSRQPVDVSWRVFIRWTIPVLGVAMAGLVLALRVPDPTPLPLADAVLSESQDEDLATDTLGELL